MTRRPCPIPLLTAVLDWLADQHEPVTATEIAAALGQDRANVNAALRTALATRKAVCVGHRPPAGPAGGRASRLWVAK